MDNKLQIVERLYGDAASDSSPELKAEEPREPGDEAREERLLAEAKFVMDHRTTIRPSPATIDRIVAYAAEQRQAQARNPSGVLTAAMPPKARILPLFPWRTAVAAVFVLFVAGIAYLRIDFGSTPAPEETVAIAQSAPGLGAETADESLDVASPATQPAARRDQAQPRPERLESEGLKSEGLESVQALGRAAAFDVAESVEAQADSVPAWDGPTDLHLLQKRIEMLRVTGQDLDWGEPVPLEQLPASATAPGIRAAGAGNLDNR